MNPIDFVLGLASVDLGIDLGTANTLVCVPGQGIILSEPSVVAVERDTSIVWLDGQAVGKQAVEMLEKTPGNIEAIRPLKDGVIADFEVTEAMLRYFIHKAHNRRWGIKPRVVIAVPSGITTVESRAVVTSAERAGARKVLLISEPKAAAIGAGLPIGEPVANMVVDIGAGTSEVAVLSLGGVVNHRSIKVAGDEFDQAIAEYILKNYSLEIGLRTAERIKIQIGSAAELDEELSMEVRGRDQAAALPRTTVVTSEEIREALQPPIARIVAAVRDTLGDTPPELSADLVERGLVLAGGGAMLRGLDRVIDEDTGLPVTICEEPLTAVARGTGVLLEDLDRYKKVFESGDAEI